MRPVTPQAAESHPTVRFNAWFNTQRERVVVSPWVLLVPLFCTACSRQLPDFADVEVNRYGHLGTATCPCGAVLNGTAPAWPRWTRSSPRWSRRPGSTCP